MKYRRRSIEVEAVQLTKDMVRSFDDESNPIPFNGVSLHRIRPGRWRVLDWVDGEFASEDRPTGAFGDWLVRFESGTRRVYTDQEFRELFEEVE